MKKVLPYTTIVIFITHFSPLIVKAGTGLFAHNWIPTIVKTQPKSIDRPVFKVGQSLQDVRKEIAEVRGNGVKLTDSALSEGRLSHRITKLMVSPVKQFAIYGTTEVIFGKPDTVTSIVWTAEGMSMDDFL